mmetsp:Transcript_8250/g.18019  ORF Transcript_8250/g.18019 Transcript_8250/m.18019 type:complete len:231 (+) Transcript_8250:88-780(+)
MGHLAALEEDVPEEFSRSPIATGPVPEESLKVRSRSRHQSAQDSLEPSAAQEVVEHNAVEEPPRLRRFRKRAPRAPNQGRPPLTRWPVQETSRHSAAVMPACPGRPALPTSDFARPWPGRLAPQRPSSPERHWERRPRHSAATALSAEARRQGAPEQARSRPGQKSLGTERGSASLRPLRSPLARSPRAWQRRAGQQASKTWHQLQFLGMVARRAWRGLLVPAVGSPIYR